MEKWTIYNKSGVAKYIATDLEYHDIWMGEEYVTIKITSPTPIELEIGDYLIYRDDVYSIYTLPSAKTYYYSFRLDSSREDGSFAGC